MNKEDDSGIKVLSWIIIRCYYIIEWFLKHFNTKNTESAKGEKKC